MIVFMLALMIIIVITTLGFYQEVNVLFQDIALISLSIIKKELQQIQA